MARSFPTSVPRAARSRLALCFALLGGLAACGPDDAAPDDALDAPDAGPGPDGGPDGPLPPDEPPSAPVLTLEDQLRELGVDVDGTRAAPRRVAGLTEGTDDWAPLGLSARLAPRELFLVGADDGTWVDRDDTTPDTPGPRSLFVEVWDEAIGAVRPATTFVRYERLSAAEGLGARPDGSGTRPGSQARRTAFAGDFDGDGREEAAIVWVRTLEGTGEVLASRLVEDGDTHQDGVFAGAPIAGGFRVLGGATVRDVAAVAGDLTGDGRPDAVIALLRDAALDLVPFPGMGGNELDSRAGVATNRVTLPATTGTRSVELAVGNLDLDPQLELVVVIRTWGETLEAGRPRGEAHAYVYDDLAADPFRLSLLEERPVVLPVPGGAGDLPAVTADVALGDYDGDGIDEIAFAGMTRVELECDESHFGVLVLDDLAHGAPELARGAFAEVTPACHSAGGTVGAIYEVIANPIQWDTDHPRELQLNQHVLDVEAETVSRLRSVQIMPERRDETFSALTHTIVAADVTKDGLDELVSFSNLDGRLRIEGHRRNAAGEIERVSLTQTYDGGEARAPVLLAFDNDVDGISIEYVRGSHRVELSEPVIHAVLAAPPCATMLGQDPSDCSTSYGTAQSSGAGTAASSTASASVMVGITVGTDLGPFSFEASYSHTVEAWTSSTAGTEYELTYSTDYTTYGRDAVVFTSVPFDVYEYSIVASADPAEVGQSLSFFFPRRPVTRPVSVKYFNDRVRPGGLRIDESVLVHQAGDPWSYRTFEEMRDLESEVRGRAPGEAFAFLKNGPKDVGATDTSVGVAIEVAETRFVEEGFGVSRSHSVAFTGGVVMGEVTVGSEESTTITTSMTESTTFASSVPGIDDDALTYAFGMFTYMGAAVGTDGTLQRFQVIDYWVE